MKKESCKKSEERRTLPSKYTQLKHNYLFTVSVWIREKQWILVPSWILSLFFSIFLSLSLSVIILKYSLDLVSYPSARIWVCYFFSFSCLQKTIFVVHLGLLEVVMLWQFDWSWCGSEAGGVSGCGGGGGEISSLFYWIWCFRKRSWWFEWPCLLSGSGVVGWIGSFMVFKG